MSYIDTFDHEFLGFFGGLPVYHPLATMSGSPIGDPDFNCDPTNLVIGGGGGEHPGVVLHHPDLAAAAYIRAWHDEFGETHPEIPKGPDQGPDKDDCYAPWTEFLVACQDREWQSQMLDFAGWSVETYHSFFEMCCSLRMVTPFHKDGKMRFENWLIANLGELIFHSLPEMTPGLEKNLPGARTICATAWPLYGNILTPPPGISFPFGRRIENNERKLNNRWWKT